MEEVAGALLAPRASRGSYWDNKGPLEMETSGPLPHAATAGTESDTHPPTPATTLEAGARRPPGARARGGGGAGGGGAEKSKTHELRMFRTVEPNGGASVGAARDRMGPCGVRASKGTAYRNYFDRERRETRALATA
jgi:hypothetical protein